MDRQALKAQEDLDLVLGDLDAQLLVSVDMRGAVIVALDVYITVRMQGGVLPVRALKVPDRQRFESGFLERFEAFAARDAEAGVATCINTLDTRAEGLVDLGEGSEARMSIAEARIAHQDFHQSFDDRFILGMIRTRWDHRGGELTSQLRISGVQVWIVQVALEHALL